MPDSALHAMEELGAGGFGTVYKAASPQLPHAEVAVKILEHRFPPQQQREVLALVQVRQAALAFDALL